MQVFSTPSDAPRIRLRTDLISAGLTSVWLALLILAAVLAVVVVFALTRLIDDRSPTRRIGWTFILVATGAAAALGIDVPPTEQLTRARWRSAAHDLVHRAAAYTLIAGLAEVAFDTIAESLAEARWSLVRLGLVLAAATNYTERPGAAHPGGCTVRRVDAHPGRYRSQRGGDDAGLTAIGVDPGTAVSAVLIYRIVSYYLPPVWGYVSPRWLTKHDYL